MENEKLLKQFYSIMQEISVLPKDQLQRFLILKARAARVLRRIKRENPGMKTIPLPGTPSLQRVMELPTDELSATPDTPRDKDV